MSRYKRFLMWHTRIWTHRFLVGFLAIGLMCFPTAVQAALLNPGQLNIQGWVRNYTSLNLQDPNSGTTLPDARHELQMIRNSIELNMDMTFARWLSVSGVYRGTREISTDYLQDLDRASPFDVDQSLYDESEIRELYMDVNVTDDIKFRIGKQQIAWGKLDFVQVLDKVHGFDNLWRSFIEPDNDDRRKPNIMVRGQFYFPSWDLTLEPLWMPGYDDGEDIGNTNDLFGGRWAGGPGFCVVCLSGPPGTFGATPISFTHPQGDPDDDSFGLRALGTFNITKYQEVEWSLNYLHVHDQNAFINPNPAFGPLGAGPPLDGVFTSPGGALGEFVFPEVDLVGGSFNTYYPAWDAVLRGELAYTFDKPFNQGNTSDGNVTCDVIPGPAPDLPGYCGFVKKDFMQASLSIDWQASWVETVFRAWRPGLVTLQLVDNWVVDYEDDEDILFIPGLPGERDEHSANATLLILWNYWQDRINPSFAWFHDVSYGGGVIIPAVNFKIGTHWRVDLELDLFYEEEAPPFSTLDNKNQFLTRITYQF